MDELQLTFDENKNKLFLWGISSDADEIFTPAERLEKIYKDLFRQENIDVIIRKISLTSMGKVPVVPISMRLFYDQFNIERGHLSAYSVPTLAVDEESLVHVFLQQEKRHGILFGDSYEFFRTCLRFAFSLVARQRFVPFFIGSESAFVPNLDQTDDYETMQDLCDAAPPSSIFAPSATPDSIRACIGHLVSLVIKESIAGINLNLSNQTKTDLWLSGLIGKKGSVDQKIQDGLNQWMITRKVNHTIEYNMLFKLQEPSEDDETWQLIFAMQSKKDPSLIVELSQIWKNPAMLPIKNARIHLLQDLGIAAKVSKTIERSLYKPDPCRIPISDEESMEFITQDSFMLQDLGFVAQIPKITSARVNSLKVKVKFKENNRFKIQGNGTLGQALFDFDYSVAMGDVELSSEEFYELSRHKEGLVNVKGRWVEINEQDMKKVLSFFEQKKKLSIADIMIANASDDTEFEIDSFVLPEKYQAAIEGLFDFKAILQSDPPEGLKGSLRPYQKQGFSWMLFLANLGFGGILADDMGLGKTIQTISYLLHSANKPYLVICPTSVVGNWQRELRRFSPDLKVYPHHGPKRLGENEFLTEIKDKDIIISSYATVRIDESIFEGIEWAAIILDEAQNIKNPYTKQAKAIFGLKSQSRFCLTGTPIENRLSELWSIMNFCNPGFLSQWSTFKNNFAKPIELQNDEGKIGLLRKIISPFILRRLKTDASIIKDLPNKTEMKEYCTLTEEQATLYQAVVDDSMKKIETEEENRRALIMATLIKLKQVCNHPTNLLKDSTGKLADRSGKVARLRELIEVFLANDEKCLIFTQYKEMGSLLESDLEQCFDTPVVFLHGELTRKKREQMIDAFQSDDRNSPKIFILSLKAGGVGINLTKANHVIHFDRWWNPAVENQATDRAYRIGQTKDVFVYKFITSGTVEERIDEMIERKLALSDSLLAQGEMAITEMDNDSLRELFNLRGEYL